MAKKNFTVTIDTTIKDNAEKVAAKELRGFSSLVEYMLAVAIAHHKQNNCLPPIPVKGK